MGKNMVFSCSRSAVGESTINRSWHVVLIMSALLCYQRIRPVGSDTVPPTTKYREVQSVSGSVGQIPCPVPSFDDVVMILWFKGSSGAPIYSYDTRALEPRHMTLKDDWGIRLYFRVWPNNRRNPALMIQDLKPADGGLYRCRVDYRNSPTTNVVTRLKIIVMNYPEQNLMAEIESNISKNFSLDSDLLVYKCRNNGTTPTTSWRRNDIEPPTRIEIFDTSPAAPRTASDQQRLSDSKKHSDPSVISLGPYLQGQNVTLACRAYGGNPLPEVHWLKNGDVVETTHTEFGTEYAVSNMELTNLGRDHTLSIYSCQANNNNATQALSHRVLLEIYLGVTSIELEVPSPMTAGIEYSIICKTTGAYPTVKVEFWKNLKRIVSRTQMKSVAESVTVTSFLYKPEVLDDGAVIKCTAENPWVLKKPSVARKTMKIKYTPVAILRLGRNRTKAFAEGESVLMECHVRANPPAHTILWFHQDRQLSPENHNGTMPGIRFNGMTLFISHLTPKFGGKYNCEAVNDVGKGISNSLPIELHILPKCVTSGVTHVPLAAGERNWLTCNVLAWPSDLHFYWSFNRSQSNATDDDKTDSPIITTNTAEQQLHQHFLPSISISPSTSTMAPGANNSGNKNDFSVSGTVAGMKSNSSPSITQERKRETGSKKEITVAPSLNQNGEQAPSRNQNGYSQLSSGFGSGSFESLNYPEHQHMSQNDYAEALNETTRQNIRCCSTEEKTISEKVEQKYTMSSSGHHDQNDNDDTISVSKRTAFSSSYSNRLNDKSIPSPASIFSKQNLQLRPIGEKLGVTMKGESKTEVNAARQPDQAYENSNLQQQQSHNPLFSILTRDSGKDGKKYDPNGFTTNSNSDSSLYGDQKGILHTSLLPISDEDIGTTIECWARNAIGEQITPCLFVIIAQEVEKTEAYVGEQNMEKNASVSKLTKLANHENGVKPLSKVRMTRLEDAGKNQTVALSSASVTSGVQPTEKHTAGDDFPEQSSPSKLQKTLGIVFIFILLFIAGLAGLTFTMLLVLAIPRSRIYRIAVTHSECGGSSTSTGSLSPVKSKSKSRTHQHHGQRTRIDQLLAALYSRMGGSERNYFGHGTASNNNSVLEQAETGSKPPSKNIIIETPTKEMEDLDSSTETNETRTFTTGTADCSDMFLISTGDSELFRKPGVQLMHLNSE